MSDDKYFTEPFDLESPSKDLLESLVSEHRKRQNVRNFSSQPQGPVPPSIAHAAGWYVGQRVGRVDTGECGTVIEVSSKIKVVWDAGRTTSYHPLAAGVLAPRTA